MPGFSDCNVEPAILARARRGDMKAHEILYRVYATPVYTLALRMLQNPSQADDILQETSIEVIRKLNALREERTFPGWIKRIAVNKCLGHLRSAWNRRSSRSDAGIDGDGSSSYEGSDLGRDAAGAEQQLDAAQALNFLSPTARAVVWLFEVEGYTHQEIGQLMGRTASFSKSQLSRAHQKLRAVLGSMEGDESCTQTLSSY